MGFTTKQDSRVLCMLSIDAAGYWQNEQAKIENLYGVYYQEIWPWMLHPGGSLPDLDFRGLRGQIYKGIVKFSWEGGKQVSDMKAIPLSGPEVHIRMTKEVVDDELFISLEDVPRGLKATLV